MTRLPIDPTAAKSTKWQAGVESPGIGRRAMTTGLLISIRSLAELHAIVDLAVDVIDFKEPRLGALTATDPSLWARAVECVVGDQKLSAALGECDTALALASLVPARFAYAKAGPAAVESTQQLTHHWTQLRLRLPESVELVAVAYADHQSAQCPDPESIFAAAQASGIKTWLLDTFGKADRQGVVDHIATEQFRRIRTMADHAQAQWVLAGSIRIDDAIRLASHAIRPDLFGVRGDVCDTAREGNVVSEKVVRWLETVRSFTDDHHHGDDHDGSQGKAGVRRNTPGRR
jgi:(5-formylfuran-3-yl)methyl phosphate synthase